MNKRLKKALLKGGMVCGLATIGLGFGLLAWTVTKGHEKLGICGSIGSVFGSFALFTQVGPLVYEISKDYHDDVAYELRKEKEEKKEYRRLNKQTSMQK